MEKKFVACVTCGKEAHVVFAERNSGNCVKCVRVTDVQRENTRIDYAATMNEIAMIKRAERSAFVNCVTCGKPANKEFAKSHQGTCLKCSGHDFARPVKQVHICTSCNKNQVYNIKNGVICIPCKKREDMEQAQESYPVNCTFCGDGGCHVCSPSLYM